MWRSTTTSDEKERGSAVRRSTVPVWGSTTTSDEKKRGSAVRRSTVPVWGSTTISEDKVRVSTTVSGETRLILEMDVSQEECEGMTAVDDAETSLPVEDAISVGNTEVEAISPVELIVPEMESISVVP